MRRMVFFLVIVCSAAVSAQGQVVRESDAGTLAGILYPNPSGEYVCQYVIHSDGQQLLTLDLDAELFMRPGHAGEEGGECGGETMAAGGGGGCASCSGDESGSTEGPSGFFLEIRNAAGVMVQSVGRPIRPGWERDPRMICHLPEEGSYILTVRFIPKGESLPEKIPFLLSASLRRIATNGYDLKLALYESKNELPMSVRIR